MGHDFDIIETAYGLRKRPVSVTELWMATQEEKEAVAHKTPRTKCSLLSIESRNTKYKNVAFLELSMV